MSRERKRGVHRRKQERRPLPGMLLHIAGSRHLGFQDDRWYDLLVCSCGAAQIAAPEGSTPETRYTCRRCGAKIHSILNRLDTVGGRRNCLKNNLKTATSKQNH